MSEMTRDMLLRKIQELSFTIVELGLFLDTHPECKMALDAYKERKRELDEYTERYELNYGPLVATSTNGDRWTWIDTPWPWQIEERR